MDCADFCVMDFDDDTESIDIDALTAATRVTEEIYDHLLKSNRCPYPNNFNICTIAVDDASHVFNAPISLEVNDWKALSFETTSTEAPVVTEKSQCSDGLLASNGACCAQSCGQCEAADARCGRRPGGALKCCSNLIVAIGPLCSDVDKAPCFTDAPEQKEQRKSSKINSRVSRTRSARRTSRLSSGGHGVNEQTLNTYSFESNQFNKEAFTGNKWDNTALHFVIQSVTWITIICCIIFGVTRAWESGYYRCWRSTVTNCQLDDK